MKTVLLIEDEVAVRNVLAHFLKTGGWRVLEAEDGERGLLLARQHHPDVIICDLLMPRCNGFQVCRAVRQAAELAHTKIIVTTGRGYATDRMNALEAGADEYLVKPIDGNALSEILNRFGARASGVTTPFLAVEPLPDLTSKFKFWGVRGSTPAPGPATVSYGGNTSCIEVRAEGELIILDAGTGIRPLGLALAQEYGDRPITLTLLLTHTHWDHIQGFPYFLPAYDAKNHLRVLGYEGSREGLKATLTGQMESPYFPIGMAQMPGNIIVEELKDLEFNIGPVMVQAIFANHPGICMGYRLNTSTGSVVYLPDNEPFTRLRAGSQPPTAEDPASLDYARQKDQMLVEFIQEADALILDAQYDCAEYDKYIGWGHGCTDDAVSIALRGRVKNLFLFHHDPNNDDEKISRMVAYARELVAAQGRTLNVEAAREGYEFVFNPAPQNPAS